MWSLSPDIKQPEREAHHSAFSCAEVKPIWNYTSPHIYVSCLPLPVIFQAVCSIAIVLTAVLELQPAHHRVRMVDALAGEEILHAINLARIEGGEERSCTRSAVRRGIHHMFV